MLTQEEYMEEVLALKRQGFTITEIATETGYHPATISKWLKAGGLSAVKFTCRRAYRVKCRSVPAGHHTLVSPRFGSR